MIKIAPSLLAADFLELGAACDLVNTSEADWFHLDVMDGLFVPNISYGMPVIKAIKSRANKPLDVHLMIEKPERYIDDFKAVGSDILSVHYEASPHLHRSIQAIKNVGMKAGVAINPHTPVSALAPVIKDIDLVCLMSVNPGFGGQSFIPYSLVKVRELRSLIAQSESKALIEVDGGVTLDNAAEIKAAGADVLVAGSSVFKAKDPAGAISGLKKA